MKLTRDDWELTLKELNSQALQLQIQLKVVEAGIVGVTKTLSNYPKKKWKDGSEEEEFTTKPNPTSPV